MFYWSHLHLLLSRALKSQALEAQILECGQTLVITPAVDLPSSAKARRRQSPPNLGILDCGVARKLSRIAEPNLFHSVTRWHVAILHLPDAWHKFFSKSKHVQSCADLARKCVGYQHKNSVGLKAPLCRLCYCTTSRSLWKGCCRAPIEWEKLSIEADDSSANAAQFSKAGNRCR